MAQVGKREGTKAAFGLHEIAKVETSATPARAKIWRVRGSLMLVTMLALSASELGCEKERAAPPLSAAPNDKPKAPSEGDEPPSPAPNPASSGLTAPTETPAAADALSSAFEATAAAIRPSVVRIDVEKGGPDILGGAGDLDELGLPEFLERFFGPRAPRVRPPFAQRGTGSGFIVAEPRGHVLTNGHVVEGTSRVTIVTSDGKKHRAKVVGVDPQTDLGLIKFEQTPHGLTAARLGDSEALRVGQWVVAVGSPLGLEQTVTAGIVSGLGKTDGRVRLSGERVRRYIQTDALINPGNSGGPLVNLKGEVIGVNTLINVGPGGSYGFAIPINQAKQVALSLAKEGRVRYPYIGVMVGDVGSLPEELRQKLGDKVPEQGAFVSEIAPGAPAARAGLKPGDVITKLAGKPVDSAGALIDQVSAQRIGSKTKIEYVRNGQDKKAEIEVDELPGAEPAPVDQNVGVVLQTLTESMAQALGMDPDTRGAVVAQVREGSPAQRAGLEPGDVIVQIDRKDVTSADDAAQRLGKPTGKPRLLRVLGPKGARFVTLGIGPSLAP